MDSTTDNTALPEQRESWAALIYFALYMAYLFAAPESELLHWLSLVAIPLVIVFALRPGNRSLRTVLDSFGIRRGNLRKCVGWALLLGATFGVIQIFFSGNSAEVQEAIRTGRALYLLPLGFVLMMLLAGSLRSSSFVGSCKLERKRCSGPNGWQY